jgi:Divergent InlB B-repeat domain
MVMALGLALATAQPAIALTRAAADRTALSILKPGRAGRSVVVDGLSGPLRAGTVVSDSGPGPRQRAAIVHTHTGSFLRYAVKRYHLPRSGWAFWEDPAAGADFSHPTRLIIIDNHTGRLTYSAVLGFYPLIGTKPAPFVQDELSLRYAVFGGTPPGNSRPIISRLFGPMLTIGDPAPREEPPLGSQYGPTECLVAIGDPADLRETNFGGDVDAITAAARSHGIKPYRVRGLNLSATVEEAVRGGCTDVWLFIAGHGIARNGDNQPTVVITHDAMGDASGVVTRDDILRIRDRFPGTTFKVTVSSCFAGRFVTALQGERNIRFVGASSGASQQSRRFGFKDSSGVVHPSPPDNTYNAGSYAYGFSHAFDHVDPAAVGHDLARALAAAQAGVASNGDAAAAARMTTPEGSTPKPPAAVVTLNVTVGGDGYGRVLVKPSGASCNVGCETRFTEGTTVTLTAEPDQGTHSHFGGWRGACGGLATTCTITITRGTSVTAIFSREAYYELRVTTSGSGTGTVTTGAPYDSPPRINCASGQAGTSSCIYTFARDSEVTLKAKPDGDSTFGGWSGACHGEGACKLRLAANATVDAKFVKSNTAGVAAPVLRPIHAVFTQATFSTVYTENATGQDLKYQWAVSIPADPPCASGFQPGKPQANQATWYHADVSEGGPCNHSGSTYDATGRGHPGTVVVVVSNGYWSCVATYYGTQGDNGAPEGDGAAPQPCRRE